MGSCLFILGLTEFTEKWSFLKDFITTFLLYPSVSSISTTLYVHSDWGTKEILGMDGVLSCPSPETQRQTLQEEPAY